MSYNLAADPLKITQVTDPFGRSASFGYSAAAPYVLTSITDEIGITSQLTYINGDSLSSLVTPYGTTSFIQNLDPHLNLQITDPKGQVECYKSYLEAGTVIPDSDPVVPSGYGLNITNSELTFANTFYWNKITTSQYGTLSSNNLGNAYYAAAHLYHWLITEENSNSGILASEKRPLESRVWFNYTGQANPTHVGTNANPTIAARLLDDGSTQAFQYSYNSIANVTQAIDPVGRTFATSYYPNGIDPFQTKQTANGANDLLATYTWNSQHRPLTYTDAAGQTTAWTWNANGQITSVTDALNETTTFAYYSADSAGKQRKGRLYQITGPLPDGQQITTFDYDAYGNVASESGPDGYNLQFSYDALSRLVQVTYPDGTTTKTTYNLLDPSTRQDRLGRTTTLVHDSLRQLTSVTDPAGRTTQYTWCKCGALSQLIDPMNNVTKWKHDLEGRTTAKIYADGSEITYGFGANSGRLITITDEQGQVKTRSFNLDGTLSSLKYSNSQNPTPNISFSYDPAYRRVSSMTDGTGTTTYSYNPITAGTVGAGKLASETSPLPNATITFSYDKLGRPVAYAVNGVGETRSPDAAGRLASSTSPLGTFGYNYVGDTGRLSSITNPNGLTCSYDYQPLAGDFRLKSITNTLSNNVFLSQHSYAYDTVGNFTRWTQTTGDNSINRSWSCGYDQANQLRSVTPQDPISLNNQATGQYSYGYDPSGNRLNQTTDSSTTTSSYNSLNQLNGVGSSNGSAPPLRTYEWDAENRLVAINYTGTTQCTQFSYDGRGRRVEAVELSNGVVQSDTKYLWSGSRICEIRDSTGANVVRRLFQRGEVVAGSNATYYYTKDHLGSVREVVDGNGVLQTRYDYDAYGNRSAIVENFGASYAFGGDFFHRPSGLNMTRFRALDSQTGRWLSRDPLGVAAGSNVYSFVKNNPIGITDPSGLCGTDSSRFAEDAAGLALLIIAAAISDGMLEPLEIDAEESLAADLLSQFRTAADEVTATTEESAEAVAETATADAAIDAESLKLTDTVANHISDMIKWGENSGLPARPYLNSPLAAREIMAARPPIPDPGGVPGALRWDVPGTLRGNTGTWELVVDPKTETILHWNFVK